MAHRILQANINHCATAQHLLVQSMAQWSISMAIVAEPYFVPPQDSWVADIDGVVAIVTQVANGCPPVDKALRGHGWAAVFSGDVAFIGVYISPRKTLAEFEAWLVDVQTLVHQCAPLQVLVAGDFNAHSVLWGSPATDGKGEALEEWALAAGLALVNRGATHTCVRPQGNSIVDLTFASSALARRIRDWEVLEEVETLSDHRYIRFDLPPSGDPSGPSRPPREIGPRWALKRMDREVLVEAAIVRSWFPDPEEPVEVDAETEWFREALTDICDASMPRVKSLPQRRSVYWWSAELAQLREECVAARRSYTRQRRRRRRDEVQERELYASYRSAKTAMREAILQARESARETMLEDLNRDPWGRPYKMVRSKLRAWAPPLTATLQPQFVENVVATLFPRVEQFATPAMPPPAGSVTSEEEDDVPQVSEGELAAAVSRLRAKNTAPGPDGVPGRAWVLALEALEPRFRDLLTECLERGRFPRQWKTGRLVLLRKDGRPADSPGAYRPIVLLDEAGKLFERVIATRLTRHLERVGPNLADCQYGFRRGRSTIDAISVVRALTDEAVSKGEVVLAVSLDIANAFNTLPWSCIAEALRYHCVPPYLRRVLADYLSDRHIVYPMRGEWGSREMSCGVPQGSVLGPLLWNVGYDWVLRGGNLRGIGVVCYADDTLVTARGSDYRAASRLATAGVAHVVGRIRRLGLRVALEKSEALCFHGPRRAPPAGAELVISGVSIGVGSTMRYLGLVLDSRWNFKEHFRRLAPRLVKAAGALGSLLPNMGGPNVACRRLYTAVVRSMALYGSPIWADDLNAHNVALLRRPQRVIALRVVRAYRTVSFEAACVLAGTVPWDLDANMLAQVYRRLSDSRSRGDFPPPMIVRRLRERARREAVQQWLQRLEEPTSGRWTVEAVRPVLVQWMARKHGALSFRLTQILSGHGCFGRYLHRIARREESPMCHHCGHAEDTAEHTLATCPAWTEERSALTAVVGADLSLSSIVIAMVESDESWQAVQGFCEEVLAQKEEAERVRETEASANSQRRRRDGRRQLAHMRRLPP